MARIRTKDSSAQLACVCPSPSHLTAIRRTIGQEIYNKTNTLYSAKWLIYKAARHGLPLRKSVSLQKKILYCHLEIDCIVCKSIENAATVMAKREWERLVAMTGQYYNLFYQKLLLTRPKTFAPRPRANTNQQTNSNKKAFSISQIFLHSNMISIKKKTWSNLQKIHICDM